MRAIPKNCTDWYSNLLGQSLEIPCQQDSNISLAEKFVDFFLNKIEKIHESLRDYESNILEDGDTPYFESFRDLRYLKTK